MGSNKPGNGRMGQPLPGKSSVPSLPRKRDQKVERTEGKGREWSRVTRRGIWITASTTQTPTQYRLHRRAGMSDLECKVLDKLLYELIERIQRGTPGMTYYERQQDKERIICLIERKRILLKERNEYVPMPAKLERSCEAQIQNFKNKMIAKKDKKVKAEQQEKDRKEIMAKKIKNKETEEKVREQEKERQQKNKREQNEQRKSKKDNKRQKHIQTETEKTENQAEPTNDQHTSTPVECCQTADECLLKDHIECLFRLAININ